MPKCCTLCGGTRGLIPFRTGYVCENCRAYIRKIAGENGAGHRLPVPGKRKSGPLTS